MFCKALRPRSESGTGGGPAGFGGGRWRCRQGSSIGRCLTGDRLGSGSVERFAISRPTDQVVEIVSQGVGSSL